MATPPKQELTSVISTNATIALPEIVAIFLSKYETDLYDRKAILQDDITGVKDYIIKHDKVVLKATKFDEYIGLKIPKLNIESVKEEDPKISWSLGTTSIVIGIQSTDTPKRDRYSNFNKTFTKPVPKADITTHNSLITKMEKIQAQLSNILNQITDMSRKERQVKARISERRLKEQGLEHFIKSPEMLELIKID